MRSSRSRRTYSFRTRSSIPRRSSHFSSSSRSFPFHFIFPSRRGSIPITKLHPISQITLALLLASFVFNFVMTIVAPFALFEWGLWIFFLPMIFAFLFMIVTVLTTIDVNQSGPILKVATRFEQSGRRLIPLTYKHSFARFFEWEENKERYLFITLPKKKRYDSRLLQAFLDLLKQETYRELWIVQDPASFLETDLDYARFYNVLLLNIPQLQEKLTPISSVD